MEEEDIEVVPNITGVVDLLGFNSYLDLGQNDLRTDIGRITKKRLDILGDAVSKINKEKSDYPERYPPGFFIKRITDSIIISADIDKLFLPEVGKKFTSSFRGCDLLKAYTEVPDRDSKKITYHEKISKDTGFLIGAIARIHAYVNDVESRMHFPGCKTTIALGLRLPSSEEDMLSANFAFSLAWKANEEVGESGKPNLYLEDSAASTLWGEKICHNLLRMSKFEFMPQNMDPYAFDSGSSLVLSLHEIINGHFNINFGHLPLTFRKVNPSPLSTLQFFPNLNPEKIKEEDKKIYEDYLEFIDLPDKEILKLSLMHNKKWFNVVNFLSLSYLELDFGDFPPSKRIYFKFKRKSRFEREIIADT